MLSRLSDHRFVRQFQDGTLLRSAMELRDAIAQAGPVPPVCEPILDELWRCFQTVRAELARRGLSWPALTGTESAAFGDSSATWSVPRLSLGQGGACLT